MNRCTPSLLAVLLLLGASASLIPLTAQAQSEASVAPGLRQFPKAALRAELVVLAPPEITLNGKPERLSPGSRIRDASDQAVLSGQLVNQRLAVNYLRDNTGLVQQVWILSSEEAKEKRAGFAETIYNFITGAGSSAAPVDDGKTPYDQLPRYQR
ncbi:hypothetical protein [Polaromonas sp.]|uniref:hypothetical protein n=1 Tax=Polaromonas sp. TaxID=1869339 RepID=UPI00286CF23D|nr:hypothetical protein [Polaromonas sp.]